MRTMEQVIKQISKVPPVPCDLKVGDTVSFTNDYGVKFTGFRIIGFETEPQANGRIVYLDWESYWFPTQIEKLRKE